MPKPPKKVSSKRVKAVPDPHEAFRRQVAEWNESIKRLQKAKRKPAKKKSR